MRMHGRIIFRCPKPFLNLVAPQPFIERAMAARYARPNKSGGNKNEQIRIGDITIDAVIEREGPWRRPQDLPGL